MLVSILKRITTAAAVTVLLASCSTTPPPVEKKEATVDRTVFESASFETFASVHPQEWGPALAAFKQSCTALRSKPAWAGVCRAAEQTEPAEAMQFFRDNFDAWKMMKETVGKDSGEQLGLTDTGLMTGYYEPMLNAVPERDAAHTTPILSTPDDLIIVDLASVYPKLKGMRLRGKLVGRKIIPYDSRSAIVQRRDLDRYAIAWSNDPVEVFFLQIQGSGRLKMPDGSLVRVGYDDQNGHPYKAVGSWLVQKGYLQRHELSMQNIQAWARRNPARVNELLDQNPSFVFFKVRQAGSPDEGPRGALGVPLTPRASVAADRRQIPLGAPLVVQVSQNSPHLEFMRPVVAQDTGGAIAGPLRFDYFWGFGHEAGVRAGKQKSRVSAWLLLPKGVQPQTAN